MLVPPKFDPMSMVSVLVQEDKIKRIKNILENREQMDLPVQQEILKTLRDDLRMATLMTTVPAHHTLSFQAVKDVYSDLLRLGVVPTNRIPTKKSAFDPTSV